MSLSSYFFDCLHMSLSDKSFKNTVLCLSFVNLGVKHCSLVAVLSVAQESRQQHVVHR